MPTRRRAARVPFEMTPRFALLAIIALALGAHVARAQTVPLLSADLDVGGGSTSPRAGDIYFRSTDAMMIATDLAIRLGNAGRTRPVLIIGYSYRGFAGDHTSDCPLAPNGGCKGWFPDTFGLSIALGVRQTLGNLALVGVSAGIASYQSQARFAELDASIRLVPHFSLVGEFRYIDLPVSGARAWFTPLTFGARLSW
jgi:hypothetical protein